MNHWRCSKCKFRWNQSGYCAVCGMPFEDSYKLGGLTGDSRPQDNVGSNPLGSRRLPNNIFSGVIAAGGITSILMFFRQWGVSFIRWLYSLLFVSVSVNSNTKTFSDVESWLATNSYLKSVRCRRFRLIDEDERSEFNNGYQSVLTIGEGTHTLFIGSHLFRISRRATEQGGNYGKLLEHYDIYCLSFSKSPIYEFLNQIKLNKSNKMMLPIYRWKDGWWDSISTRNFRDESSLFTNNDIIGTLKNDLNWFLNNSSWYNDRGIPYRRGYLLSGAPSPGKTSIVSILASLFHKGICILDINNCRSDSELLEVVIKIPKNTIILIEDVDAISHKKVNCRTKRGDSPDDNDDDNSSGVSLSGLLNALDGISYKDGTIIIMTSNHPDEIDHAILRPGRINLHVKFDLADIECCTKMLKAFYPDISNEDINEFRNIIPAPIQQARLQELFIGFKDDPKKLLNSIKNEDIIVKSILGEI